MNAIARSVFSLVWISSLCLAPFGSSTELPSSTSSLFSASGNCVFCHDQWGGALTDQQGRSVSITADWSGTMMAHAFKDPLWRAVMEVETVQNPGLKGFIENKCQTCHAPMARTQHHKDKGTPYAYAQGKKSQLAADGVSCTLCHQIQPDKLGHPDSFTGQYVIKGKRQIFGPYPDVFTMPMQHHVDYTPQFGAQVQNSALCATCHTLYTPILDAANKPVGQFPEQVPYLEWQASDHARAGKHCQDCHMPRLEEAIRISARPPWLDPRKPFWRHQFVGGNAFMVQLLAGREQALQPHADEERLAVTAEMAREQLRRAAELKVDGRREKQTLTLDVDVINRAGHKFPTGHPYRRAWLHVQVRDQDGKVLFESGATDASGRLSVLPNNLAPHFDEISRPDQVQIYEAAMVDGTGERTYALLRAVAYLKDNRIPPQGFAVEDTASDIAIRGEAVRDVNFNAGGNGRDRVVYRIDLGPAEGTVTATVDLFYQSVPPEAVERLAAYQTPEARRFTKLYRGADKSPETVQTRSGTY